MRDKARRWIISLHAWWSWVGVLLRNLWAILGLALRRPGFARGDCYLIVTLGSLRHGRYGFQLLNYFTMAGYRIVLYDSLGFLCRLSGYDRMVLDLPGIQLWQRRMSKDRRALPWIRLGDGDVGAPPFPVSVAFRLDFDYFRMDPDQECFYLPYFVHPLLGRRLDKTLASLPRGGRRRRVLMYGQPDLAFDRDRLEGHFGLLGRSDAFNALSASGLPRFAPRDFEELLAWMHQPEDASGFCLIDSRKVWIPVDRWLEVLVGFDAFIATPGYCMPHAHNLMEAIAVGTIPVLEYHHHLRPVLTPGEDCLAFSGREGLLRVVEELLRMDEAHMARLRQGVLRYYSDHVDPCTVVPRLFGLAAEGTVVRLCFNAEELSLQRLDRRLAGT